MLINTPISLGELVDKISILIIKQKNINEIPLFQYYCVLFQSVQVQSSSCAPFLHKSDANNYNLDESFFYTDSINDLPLIKACPNSIIISPDKKLEKYAKENNLSILERKIHE